jgi:hypothetical protein
VARSSAVGRFIDALSVFGRALNEYYAGPYRQTLARERRDEDDLFRLIVLGEALGVPDPAAYYTVELMPLVAPEFHDWHRRMGMPRSPLDHVACC